MFKLIARAVLPLLAATTVASAADLTAGRITFIDNESHRVLVDNVPVALAANADLSGFGLGDMVNVAYPLGKETGARIAAYAPIVATTTTGRITSIRADVAQIVVANQIIQVPADIDLSRFQLGRMAQVTMTSVAGFNTALAIGSNQMKLVTAMVGATEPASGRITFLDLGGRQVVVDNSTWLQVPANLDMNNLRVGNVLNGSFSSASGVNVLTRLASL